MNLIYRRGISFRMLLLTTQMPPILRILHTMTFITTSTMEVALERMSVTTLVCLALMANLCSWTQIAKRKLNWGLSGLLNH